eukprot:TRINITY_DN2989_c0_g1_i2.p1 TRINITY_DN2989_c0_g1~~TRINITY_DN2989_c0_g1_i2.p1  ORF type:complete len:161 (-),score=28.00 TRINITY_DN2989_c0_g1_i2:72-554(-)
MGGALPSECDAGFQYSPTYDNWAPVLRTHSWQTGTRIPGGYQTAMWFQSDSENGTVTFGWSCMGCTSKGSLTSSLDQVIPSRGYLKRCTSIAQNHDNFTSGSFLKNVEWQNCAIGTTPEDAVLWTDETTGGFTNYPDKSVVQVQYASDHQEIDNIVCDGM